MRKEKNCRQQCQSRQQPDEETGAAQPAEDQDRNVKRSEARLCLHQMSPFRSSEEGRLVEKAASLLAPMIKRLGLSAGVHLGRIRGEWHALFGPTLSAHMSPSKLAEGELLLNVDQPIWMQQLTFHKRQIVEKLGPYGVKDVRFRIGRIHRMKTPGRPSRVPEELSSEDAAFVNTLVSGVDDENLRQAIRRAVEKSLRCSSVCRGE
jgi:hypothetical protein